MLHSPELIGLKALSRVYVTYRGSVDDTVGSSSAPSKETTDAPAPRWARGRPRPAFRGHRAGSGRGGSLQTGARGGDPVSDDRRVHFRLRGLSRSGPMDRLGHPAE